ncbi:MalY/PatB family protein [Alkalibacter mobilis]|uniref:MalY/PatB family protein n=1 Tax=Alkalibacter mobilis TaxID=2787712 RepID=UPI00189C713D|nr:MalY/PatB family protein [Alkalibacter mobilis]MBF7097429.1 pyridoxal phosphate-dependent aminotransferase [Alkalibacter mobilis]
MKYDFESIVDRRNSGSFKYQQMYEWNPNVSKEIIPFSVADMELKNPPEIIKGLQEYLEDVVLGYTKATRAYFDSVINWMKRRHDWEIRDEWIVGAPGVVHAFFTAIKGLTEPGNGIIIMTPVYYPFYRAIESNGRRVVKNPLKNSNGRYEIDFDDLERKAMDPNNKILLFCSPHNPVGRVWTKNELARVSEICIKNGVLVVSDEIHFDFVMPGYDHSVYAEISDDARENCIVCTAPSKTFNLAGMQTSNIIIPNEEIRNSYIAENDKCGQFTLNILGYKACEIAYNSCEEWLEQLLELVHHNHVILKKYFEEHIPQIKVYDLEGTYLQWLDFRGLGMKEKELENFLHLKAELFLDEGYIFGREGSGFERMNLACPTKYLVEGLNRLKCALAEI